MRNLLCLTVACCTALVLACATAKADDKGLQAPQANQDTQASKNSVEAKDPRASNDSNYRWHNGQWWYWMPQQRNWQVWHGREWTPFVAGRSTATEVRTYSYQGQNTQSGPYDGDAVQRLFGTPLSTVPDSVSDNNQIIGSYGMRGAGSKQIGKY
ncbi:MAG: hypothetical protein DWQ37_23445 [Planctomycetota bacterium]|nr:MAG: hypothetical protein DWQ37_23445 [Planctomycetota bacterium]